MSKKARQHYIPVFYLMGFVDEACPPGQEPYLWVYQKGRTAPFRRAPRNVAARLHFYSVVTAEHNQDLVAEELLSSIESRAARAWRRLSDGTLRLSKEARGDVATFVASLAVRTPRIRAAINAPMDGVARRVIELTLAHYDELTGAQRDAIELSRAQLQHACAPGMFRFEASRPLQVGAMLSVIPGIARMVYDMQWAVLHSSEEHPFVTCDSPVVLVNPCLPSSWPGGAWFSQPGVEITLPIEAHSAMLLTWEGAETHRDLPPRGTAEINLRTVRAAANQVYAPGELQWLDDLWVGAFDDPGGA
jgi:hypothetical protein